MFPFVYTLHKLISQKCTQATQNLKKSSKKLYFFLFLKIIYLGDTLLVRQMTYIHTYTGAKK